MPGNIFKMERVGIGNQEKSGTAGHAPDDLFHIRFGSKDPIPECPEFFIGTSIREVPAEFGIKLLRCKSARIEGPVRSVKGVKKPFGEDLQVGYMPGAAGGQEIFHCRHIIKIDDHPAQIKENSFQRLGTHSPVLYIIWILLTTAMPVFVAPVDWTKRWTFGILFSFVPAL